VRAEGGELLETFREPLDIDLSDPSSTEPIRVSFLRAISPGPRLVQLRLEGAAGAAVGMRALSITVPAMSSEFRAEDAGPLTASAVILESANRPPLEPGATGYVRFLPPSREVPVGLLRIECEVKPPVTRVEFHLGDKKILTKNRAPYTVELDLGTLPKKQTLRALGFDKLGSFVDADAWAIGERDAQLAVRILELPKKTADGFLEVKVAVQSITGAASTAVKLFLDDALVHEWKAPPYTFSVPEAKLKKATLLRAAAFDADGKEYADIKFLKGDSRFAATVEVRLVELPTSVYDKEGRFVKGLQKEAFTVLEDKRKVDLASFEFAESLPLSLGIVIDGSGSMKDSLPVVREAATEFVRTLVGEKDQGFLVEFREKPTLVVPMTKRASDLVRGIAEVKALGATSLYDSIVLSLYQFRAVPGRKAIVVLSDGKDNHSSTEWETLRRYVRTAGIPTYVIGLDLSLFDVSLKSKLKEVAADTGAEAFYISSAKDLAQVYKRIETELRSQYFLTYLAEAKKAEDLYRTVEVKLADPALRAKTVRGYFP